MSHPLLLVALAATPEAVATPAADTQGVTPYPAAFFAESQPNSAMDMITRIPGFAFDGGDNVRGYGGAAGNVLIDGQRPATKSESLEDALRRIQAGQVERIDIIRGGTPGIDMQGKTVIANVILRKDKQGQWLLAAASAFHEDGRTTPTVRFEGSQKYGEHTFDWSILPFTFVDDGAGEGPRQIVDSGGGLLRESFSDETGGGRGLDLKAGVKSPFVGGRLALNSKFHEETYEWSLNDFISVPSVGRLAVNDTFKQRQGEFGVSYEKALGEALKMELTGLVNRRYSEFSSRFADGTNDGLFTQDNESGESIIRGVLRYTVSPDWSVEGGGEVAYNYLDSALDYVENGVVVTLPASDVLVEETRGEMFGATTWRPMPKLSVEGGLRVEVSTIAQSGDTDLEKTLTYAKPRLAVTWSPTAADQFRFRFEREVGQLDFGDFVSSVAFSTGTGTAGNADLEPSSTWVSEATYERKFWKDGALVITLAHQAITDATDRVPIIGPGYAFDAPGNIGDGVSDSLRISLNLPLSRFGVPGGLVRTKVSWNESEVTDPVTGETRRISGQHPVDAELRFSQDLTRYRLQWGVDAFMAFEETYYRFDQIETVKLQNWVTAYAEYKPRPDLSFRFEAHNLLGRDFIRERVVYTGPRDTATVDFTDNRPLDFPALFYFRIRKTFS